MLDKKIEGYRRTFRKYGVDPRALQWRSKEGQARRLRELVADIDFGSHRPLGPMARRGKSVLDVGCGFADIIPFIESKTRNIDYTGVDLVPEFIKVCKEKYPSYQFLLNDYFETPIKTKFDIVMTSGTLNANIKKPYEY